MEGFPIEIPTILKGRPLNGLKGAEGMEHTRSGSDILVRLDPGEEIHAALKELADDLGFDAAAITSGIGRTRDNQYGYMNEEGVYQRRPLDPPSELVSLSGNIARTKQGEPFTHIHCCWSDDDNNVHACTLLSSSDQQQWIWVNGSPCFVRAILPERLTNSDGGSNGRLW